MESGYAEGSPAATHFLCFAKESKQRKATAEPLPFGFPFMQDKKWEANETRLRLRQRSLLFPFSVLHKRQRQSGGRSKAKPCWGTACASNRQGFGVAVGLPLFLMFPHVTLPRQVIVRRIKSANFFEVKQGIHGTLFRACVTVSACKRICALQG